MVEDACRYAMDQSGDVLGSQLPFAVYRAVHVGALPESLRSLFRAWRSPPEQLMSALDSLDAREPATLVKKSPALLNSA
jgi:hypothetical protein